MKKQPQNEMMYLLSLFVKEVCLIDELSYDSLESLLHDLKIMLKGNEAQFRIYITLRRNEKQ